MHLPAGKCSLATSASCQTAGSERNQFWLASKLGVHLIAVHLELQRGRTMEEENKKKMEQAAAIFAFSGNWKWTVRIIQCIGYSKKKTKTKNCSIRRFPPNPNQKQQICQIPHGSDQSLWWRVERYMLVDFVLENVEVVGGCHGDDILWWVPGCVKNLLTEV